MVYIAFDGGTTTLAAELSDGGRTFSSVIENPQRNMGGADVVSRILAGKDEDKRKRLTAQLREGIAYLTDSLCRRAGISTAEIASAVFCGNTVMTAYFAGEDPSGMGEHPFTPPELFGREAFIPDVGLSCPVYLFPCASAFLGGDAVAGALRLISSGTSLPVLLADLGTNGELLLLTEDRMYGASTAAGPAFEGASLDCGSAARRGAVSSVSDSGELSMIGGGEPRSLCGSGVISAVSYLLRNGLCSAAGVLEGSDIPLDRRYYFAPGVYLSGRDIREILTAKAAICAGTEALLRHSGITQRELVSVRIAGSFGKWLSPKDAETVGLFPKGIADRVLSAGNTALDGAFAVAGDPRLRKTAEELAASIETLVLASDRNFAEEFLRCMEFDVVSPQ